MANSIYNYPPGVHPVANSQHVFYTSQPEPIHNSVIPKPMYDIMKWIETNTADAERVVFSTKDIPVIQMQQTMFELLEKWKAYFVEYEKYGKQIAAELEFQALQQRCAEKTLDLVRRMKAIKSNGRAYMNSTRLRELAKEFKKLIKLDIKQGVSIKKEHKERVEKIDTVTFVSKEHTVISGNKTNPAPSTATTVPHSFSNPGMTSHFGTTPVATSIYQSPTGTNDFLNGNNGVANFSNPTIQPTPNLMTYGLPCGICRIPVTPGMRFCGSCGSPQQQAPPQLKFCTSCGTQLNTKFCGNCGTPSN